MGTRGKIRGAGRTGEVGEAGEEKGRSRGDPKPPAQVCSSGDGAQYVEWHGDGCWVLACNMIKAGQGVQRDGWHGNGCLARFIT
eukprot:scaffold145801_cov19-Tisochrysis_lutea.AAC.1